MINKLIPPLDPPADGLDRLRLRMQSQPRKTFHPALAGLAAAVVVMTLLLLPARNTNNAFEQELRQIVETARLPSLGVDGRSAQAWSRPDAPIEIFLVNSQPANTGEGNSG
jgi:hypothetical protein